MTEAMPGPVTAHWPATTPPEEIPPDEARLSAAFPARLESDVRAAIAVMPAPGFRLATEFTVSVDTEEVTIPYRIYNPEPPATENQLTGTQALTLDCLYTRHNDGRVRQRRLQHLLASSEPWVVPFVVQLVGEYVIEILKDIQHALAEAEESEEPAVLDAYRDFLVANPSFQDLTEARVMSYWSCYYRAQYPNRSLHPNRHDYPGIKLIRLFRQLGDETRRDDERATTEGRARQMPRATWGDP